VRELPRTPDLGIICAPAGQVPELLEQCGEAGIHGVIINSAGFREAGEAGAALETQLREVRARFDGLRILGPNCLGLIVPGTGLNASFAAGMPQDGHIAFISQSGALCASVLDWALEEKIGFSNFVSVGNMMDVDFGDLIDYLGEDERTRSIILYIESITNARKFMTAARAFARTKPIVAYKAGRFPESAAAAVSHTGAMVSEDAVFEAAFQRTGIARVLEIGEIFDCAELIGRKKTPHGPRLGIVTNAGGPGVMATDALIAATGVLATLSPESLAKLSETLPPMWSRGNPVDVLGDARSKRVTGAVQVLLDDPGVDAVLVIITPQAMTQPTSIARALGQISETSHKPILAAWLGGQSMREGIRILSDAGVPSYRTPEQAVHGFMTLVNYARNLEILYETPKDIPVTFTLDRTRLRSEFDALIASEGTLLSESVSKGLLEAYGISVSRPHPADSADEAVALAERLGYPVVLKILSPDISHKTDVGGVALGLSDAAMVREAHGRILRNAHAKRPDARVHGVTVQPMIRYEDGMELILGTKKDPVFGTVIMAGMGGVAAEVIGDHVLGFPPLNERLARRMLESLKSWPLLEGYRNRPAMDVDRLIEVLVRLSYLVADYPEIAELDINPLLVTPGSAIALDARVVIDRALVGRTLRPYEHLALRPYPEEYVRVATLPDDALVTLRPIKPEDEPLWMDLLARCSRESIYARFRHAFHWQSHDVAVRYCFIDYDREIAIVAETVEGGRRQLLGVVRLVADPARQSLEYAILVADAWQNRGLGGIMTDYSLEIAAEWGVKRVFAQTHTDNPRMISVLRQRGFEITFDASGLVEAVKDME
jgi:acetyltransferase